jgi:hypothetical protein
MINDEAGMTSFTGRLQTPTSQSAFSKDLDIGLQIEKKVLAILQRKYKSASIVNAHKGYDIWIPEIHKSVEVKSDQKSKYTGNIVIEIEMYDKPSGLMATEADYWVFYDGEMFVIMPTKNIFKCIFESKLQYIEFVGKGDTRSKKAFLVDKNTLFKYGKIL